MNAVFLDRDGTINVGVPTYERVDSLDKVELLPNVNDALQQLAKTDFSIFFITNQAGLAEGLISQEQFDEINEKVLELIKPSGIDIVKTYVCSHDETSSCDCRKPKPGMLLQASREFDIELRDSWMIGDRTTDVMTGVNAGTRAILVKTGVQTIEAPDAEFTAQNLLEAVKYIVEHS